MKFINIDHVNSLFAQAVGAADKHLAGVTTEHERIVAELIQTDRKFLQDLFKDMLEKVGTDLGDITSKNTENWNGEIAKIG